MGHSDPHHRTRALAILSVPTLSLLLPALAVWLASAGGSSQLTRTAADVARFLLYYSGVFALVALTAAVAAGLLATDRTLMTPERRIFAQALHRTTSLTGVSALANHIMLEVLAHRAKLIDGFVPFLSARSTFYMGLGTLSSDLFVVIILTGALRLKFSKGARRWVWRGLHVTAYAAWPMAVLHGLLAGRSARPYVDWSYGGCLAAVALALTFRYVVLSRGRSAADPVRQQRPRALPGLPGAGPARAAAFGTSIIRPPVQAAAYPALPPGTGPAGYPADGYPADGYPADGYPPDGYGEPAPGYWPGQPAGPYPDYRPGSARDAGSGYTPGWDR
jgi:hypothetical protein